MDVYYMYVAVPRYTHNSKYYKFIEEDMQKNGISFY